MNPEADEFIPNHFINHFKDLEKENILPEKLDN